jgi:hypothetical protein
VQLIVASAAGVVVAGAARLCGAGRGRAVGVSQQPRGERHQPPARRSVGQLLAGSLKACSNAAAKPEEQAAAQLKLEPGHKRGTEPRATGGVRVGAAIAARAPRRGRLQQAESV